jgi:hypothetical protein
MPGDHHLQDMDDNSLAGRYSQHIGHGSAPDTTYEDLLQNESIVIKERTLERIRNAQRERAFSNLTQSVCSQDSYMGEEDSDDSDADLDLHSNTLANMHLQQQEFHHALYSVDTDNNNNVNSGLQAPHGEYFVGESSMPSVASSLASTIVPPPPPSPGRPPSMVFPSAVPLVHSQSQSQSHSAVADNDLRNGLFGAIPEPYYHSKEFSRVVVTDTAEPVDYDTKEACKTIKVRFVLNFLCCICYSPCLYA